MGKEAAHLSLKEELYSVLIVSASERFNSMLPVFFPTHEYGPVTAVTSISSARRAVTEMEFDIVLVNSPLPDGQGLRLAADISASSGSAVMLLIRDELYGEAFERLAHHGVFLLRKPLSEQYLNTAKDWLITARERLKSREKKNLSIEEKMNEIRTVNRAKWILISVLGMSEPDAHRYIEKQAMDRSITRKAVAEEIIKTYQ